MNAISRNVIRDLLPVYLSGEASAESRELVEYHVARDPELREIVDALECASPPPVSMPDHLVIAELRCIDETRRLLNRKLMLSTASFSLTSVSMLMALVRTHVVMATLFFVIALAGWLLFLDTCRKLAATGLEPPRSRTLNMMWSGIGAFAGHAAYQLLLSWTSHEAGRLDSWALLGLTMTIAGWAIAWMLGSRWRFVSPGTCDHAVGITR